MLIEEKELNQMGIKLNELKKLKGPKVAGTDKQEDYDGLIQQAEYHHWQLIQAKKCGSLLDNYYAYRDKAKKSANRRLWLTYFGFFFAYLIALFCFVRFAFPKNASFIESIEMLGALSIVSLVIAGVHLFVNYYIFDHIDTSGLKDIAFVFIGTMLYYLILFWSIAVFIHHKSADTESTLESLYFIVLFSGVSAGLHVWINSSIFLSIKQKDEKTDREIKKIEDEIRRVSETVDTHRPLKESIPIWKDSVYYCIDELTKL